MLNRVVLTTKITMQSLFNKEHSFKDILKRQAVNTGVGALANLGAQEIGKLAHETIYVDSNGNPVYIAEAQINKTTQLMFHALLGTTANSLTGNDALSGAISGVAGELTGEYMKSLGYGKNTGSDLAGLTGGLSALFTGKLTGLDNNEIANNMFAGQRLGEIVAENNAFGTATVTGCALGGPIGCGAGAIVGGVIIVGGIVAGGYAINEVGNSLNDKDGEKSKDNTNNGADGATSGSGASAVMPDGRDDNGDKGKDKKDKGNNQNNKGKTSKETDDILKDSKKDPHQGKSKIYEKDGGYNQAEKDFEKIRGNNPTKTEQNGTITSKDANGNKINVRMNSSDGRPTLEIQKGINNVIKIRY